MENEDRKMTLDQKMEIIVILHLMTENQKSLAYKILNNQVSIWDISNFVEYAKDLISRLQILTGVK